MWSCYALDMAILGFLFLAFAKHTVILWLAVAVSRVGGLPVGSRKFRRDADGACWGVWVRRGAVSVTLLTLYGYGVSHLMEKQVNN